MSGSTESAGYIHGTTPSEQDRLATLNRLTNQAFVEFLEVRPQARVLEVGSGLGHLAGEVADAAEGVQHVEGHAPIPHAWVRVHGQPVVRAGQLTDI